MRYETWRNSLVGEVRSLKAEDFAQIALEVFRFQQEHNPVYRQFLQLLDVDPHHITGLDQIPCLPIEAFKHQPVKTGSWSAEVIFESSGTTKSRHHLKSLSHYHARCIRTFEKQVKPLEHCTFFGLLPHYLEAGQSSLVNMVSAFMEGSGQDDAHFYLRDFDSLVMALQSVPADKVPVLFGVSYALLDFAEAHPHSIPESTLIIETGGMKGRQIEWDKQELHQYLRDQLGIDQIWSEYGMTELCSQAYASDRNNFIPADSLRVFCKEVNDPLTLVKAKKVGVIHVIDLANVDSCAFIATSDIGKSHGEQGFEILGRLHASDLRGCQLLYV